jgi:hypothetical protein
MIRVMRSFRGPRGYLGAVAWLFILRRHSKVMAPANQLVGVAVRVAADVSDDGEAVAAVRAVGGKPEDYQRAAEAIRGNRYRYEHRNDRRAARLLDAAADGGPLVRASNEEEALFRAVDSLEALPIEDAFQVLAAEVPALRELEHQVVASRSVAGWEGRDGDERTSEILDNLDRLLGPHLPAGSLFIRSAVANGYARVHLLGKAGLLEVEADPGEHADLLALLARGYGVAPDVKRVAKAIRKRVGDRDDYPTRAVLALLLTEPGIGERLRRGDGPSDSCRKRMTRILPVHRYPMPAEFVDRVVAEVRSTFLRASADTDDR